VSRSPRVGPRTGDSRATRSPRVLLVDNHDSYTFNLAALLRNGGADVEVLTNDDPALGELGADDLDALVISPGPGTPLDPADVGHVPYLLARLDQTPVLGVCLGHQLLAHLAGAPIEAIAPHHGHISTITHDGTGLFAGLPRSFSATRYHSLAVVVPAGASAKDGGLRVTARAEDGVVMGLEIDGRPWHGVQFHPESVASQYGDALVHSFLTLAGAR
jgi:para-aminobenzoate synthetase